MKTIERILWILFLIGIIFNLALIPGGSILTVLIGGLLAMIYPLIGFFVINDLRINQLLKGGGLKNIKPLHVIGAIFTGMSMSLFLIGLMFKLMMWPGASAMVFLGVLSSLIIIVISGVKYALSKSVYYTRVFIRLVPMSVVALLLLVFSSTLIEIKYRNAPEYLKAIDAAAADPFNEALQQKVVEERMKMESVATE